MHSWCLEELVLEELDDFGVVCASGGSCIGIRQVPGINTGSKREIPFFLIYVVLLICWGFCDHSMALVIS